MRILSVILRPFHSCAQCDQAGSINWSEFKLAVPIALTVAVGLCVVQKFGVRTLVDIGTASYSTAFVIGITASLSPCMAVVGGLTLSISAIFGKQGKLKPQLLFHAGRLISFFVFGGVIGAIGSAFALNASATIIVSLVIAIVMLIFAFNLLHVSHWSKRIQPSMPKLLAQHSNGASKLYQTFVPSVVGIATFFLPCGFTQSMQIYALSTGNFLSGALTMGSFALGTLPMLALVSFSSLTFRNRVNLGVFVKSAGLIVILMALYNVMGNFVATGLSHPLVTAN